MRKYYKNNIKTFPILDNLCSSKKYYDELKGLYKTLLLSEVATLDWQKLQEKIIRATPNLTSKMAVSKLIYNFLKPKYGDKEAFRITWLFRKYFNLLFEKAYFFNFYHLSMEGIWLLEQLGKFEKYHKKPKKSNQVGLVDFFTNPGRVRV